MDVTSGPNTGASFRAEEPSFIIGRGRTNRVILRDEKISAHHAQVDCREDKYIIRDLGSTNGTFVNGKAITVASLKAGDEVRIGQTVLKITSIYVGQVKRPDKVSISDAGPARAAPVQARVSHETSPPVLDHPAEQTALPELADAYRRLLAMYKVSSIIRSSLDLDKLLDEVLAQVFRNFRAERGLIMLVDDESGELVPAVFRSRSEDPGAAEMTISRTIVSQVVEKQEAILTSDATLDDRFKAGQSIIQQDIRSVMCAPLSTKNRVLGIIYVDCRSEAGTFKKADLELLTAIGNEAGIAVENRMLRDANIKAERLAAVGQTVADLSHYIKNVLSCMQAGSDIVTRALDLEPEPAR